MENPFEILEDRLDRIERLLVDLVQRTNVPLEESNTGNEFINVKEVAAYLYLTFPTIYSKVHNGELPNYKRGKRLMFKKTEIDEWIAKGKRMSYDEINEAANSRLDPLNRRRNRSQ